MKTPLLIVISIFMTGVLFSQPVCSADSLKYFEGKVITVCSKVTSTFVARENKTTFISFGEFPVQKFTVIILPENLQYFNYTPSEYLKGKNVCILGDVRISNSGVEIFVDSDDQIVVNE